MKQERTFVHQEKATYTRAERKKRCERKFFVWRRFIAFGMLVTRLVELYVHISKQRQNEQERERVKKSAADANKECVTLYSIGLEQRDTPFFPNVGLRFM